MWIKLTPEHLTIIFTPAQKSKSMKKIDALLYGNPSGLNY